MFRANFAWVVEDSTNLHKASVDRLKSLAANAGAEVFTVEMNADVEECVARDVLRVDSCGEDVIWKMAARMENQ